MNFLNQCLKSVRNAKNMKTYEVLLAVLLVLYLVSGVSTPYNLSPYVNNVFMYGSLLALVVILCLRCNPLLAILFGVVALELVRRSRKVDHNLMRPSESNKNRDLKNMNAHLNKTTLEEEMVGQITAPSIQLDGPAGYEPVLSKVHNATVV